QEWFQGGNLFTERFQPFLPDVLPCAFGDDERALPIILAVEQDEHLARYYVPEGLPPVRRTSTDSHPQNIHRRAKIDYFETRAFANDRTSAVRPDRQRGANLKGSTLGLCANARNTSVLFDETDYFRRHHQMKSGITAGLFLNEIEEVPLWHQGHKF